MCYYDGMDIQQKINTLQYSAKLDCDGSPNLNSKDRKAQFIQRSRWYVTHPQRGKIPLMKIMQTSACERHCHYCPFRAGRNYRRLTLKPTELAQAFDQMQRKKLVDGLFLSSGIIGGGVKTMDTMLDTVDIIRHRYQYEGYIHLKMMPGAEANQLERAVRLADRLSINLEGANEKRLPILAPNKNFITELLPPLYWVDQNKSQFKPWVKLPSLTTQFVVGPAGESDQELLTTANTLYQQANLSRAYYAAFSPIRDTPFEHKTKTNPTREHRLYQADWLLRFYGFQLSELPFDTQGNLPLQIDPKLLWANHHLHHRPIEINRASKAELLRVPGIGPKTVQAILTARQKGSLHELHQLKKLGVYTQRAAPFIVLNGRQPAYQPRLPGLG